MRLKSLDALRGFDMLMIMGFDTVVVSLCVACGWGADCGFSSPQYFNDVFRKQTGSTPSAWRRAHLPKK